MFGEPADQAMDAYSVEELEQQIRTNLAALAGIPHTHEEPKMPDEDLNDTQMVLRQWWRGVADEDFLLMAPKISEYGSQDLEVMGRAMIALHPNRDAMDPTEQRRVGLEMAIAFYLLGKVSRLFGAYSGGGVPSDDTWHDAVVYGMMGRRVRETGGWPN